MGFKTAVMRIAKTDQPEPRSLKDVKSAVVELRHSTLKEIEEKLGIQQPTNGAVRKRVGRSLRRRIYPELTKEERKQRRDKVGKFIDAHSGAGGEF